uniref:CIDE-N domain-containing protein n=1 Tax=Photinus pyralis TaxID=7054 RepID=A0A1Y1KI19_PHOPY
MGTVKGFKVTDSERKTRVGIAAKSLEDLKKKTVDKFKLPEQKITFQTADGTVIDGDDYFETLQAQSLLIWVKEGERAETDAEILYKAIREVNDEYLSAGEKVQEFFTEKMKNKVFKLAEVLKGIDTNKTLRSTREDHPEWFEGLDTRSKTKEEYMFRRAQDRVRTYYYKTKEELRKNANLPPERLHTLLLDLHDGLKFVKFFGNYFDRSCAIGDRKCKSLCDETGKFLCEGRWDKGACLYKPMHSINPYTSREARIIFQTWNLDHIIERSRSVIPAIVYALSSQDSSINGTKKGQLDTKKIFNDLFSVNNLKFVHIICHDKGAHVGMTAGPYLM